MARGSRTKLSPVCAFVAERTGTSLSEQQIGRLRELLSKRLAGRPEAFYLEYLKTREGQPALAELMACISVHKTDLFRDVIQLDSFMKNVLLPMVRETPRSLHLWSAGCATGEEVATLLILLAEAGADPDSTVLGTDISDAALSCAQRLSFKPEIFERVPPRIRERYFTKNGNELALVPQLRQNAQFIRHNLMDVPYPMARGVSGFDVIFCRNVLIYMTDESFDWVIRHLARRLEGPQGTLVLSASEPLLRPVDGLQTLRCDQAFFYRVSPPGAVSSAAPAPTVRGTQPLQSLTKPSVAATSNLPTASATRDPVPPRVPETSPTNPSTVALDDPLAEALGMFQSALDSARNASDNRTTEQMLRQCLYLDPHLAQARYLLATLLEPRSQKEAAVEYRRALNALKEGKARQTPFFLNNVRLQTACEAALTRLGPSKG